MFRYLLLVTLVLTASVSGAPSPSDESKENDLGKLDTYVIFLIAFSTLDSEICRATLISPTSLLTSASCFDGFEKPIIVAFMASPQNRMVKILESYNMVTHPSYNETTHENDYAVIYLEETFSEVLEPFPINQREISKNENLFVIDLDPFDIISFETRFLVEQKKCEKAIDNFNRDTEVCVQGLYAEDECKDIIGTPVFTYDRKVVGITSDDMCNKRLSALTKMSKISTWKHFADMHLNSSHSHDTKKKSIVENYLSEDLIDATL